MFNDHHFSYRIEDLEVFNHDLEFKKAIKVIFSKLEIFQFLKKKSYGNGVEQKEILSLDKKGQGLDTESDKVEILIDQFIENEYFQGKSLKNFGSHIFLKNLLIKIKGDLNTIKVLQKSLTTCSDMFFKIEMPKKILDTSLNHLFKEKNSKNEAKMDQNELKYE